jgi:urease accessory protein
MMTTLPRHLQGYATAEQPRSGGVLEMTFESAPSGRTVLCHLHRQVPLVVQQELYFDSEWRELPCVYILSSGGPNLGGDRFRQRIELRRGAVAHISTGAATKVAEMPRDYSSVDTLLTLDEGAYLEWLPEPTILCRHARLHTTTRMEIAPSATLFYSEIFMAGRKHRGELWEFDLLSTHTTVTRPDGTPLCAERMVVQPAAERVRAVGVMRRWDVWACVTILTPKECADAIYNELNSSMEGDVALGVTHLPRGAGLAVRIVGAESAPVKRAVREVCGCVRRRVQGRAMPEEFPWR